MTTYGNKTHYEKFNENTEWAWGIEYGKILRPQYQRVHFIVVIPDFGLGSISESCNAFIAFVCVCGFRFPPSHFACQTGVNTQPLTMSQTFALVSVSYRHYIYIVQYHDSSGFYTCNFFLTFRTFFSSTIVFALDFVVNSFVAAREYCLGSKHLLFELSLDTCYNPMFIVCSCEIIHSRDDYSTWIRVGAPTLDSKSFKLLHGHMKLRRSKRCNEWYNNKNNTKRS